MSFGLRRATRALSQVYDRTLAPAGVTGTQFSILALLSKTGPTSINPLAQHLGMDRTSLSRTLKPLMRDQLIGPVEGRDRRERPIAITEKGTSTLNEARPLWRAAQQTAVSALGQDVAKALLAQMNELETALRKGS
jgi:DNA-binding MarR family transcriptional regulator